MRNYLIKEEVDKTTNLTRHLMPTLATFVYDMWTDFSQLQKN